MKPQQRHNDKKGLHQAGKHYVIERNGAKVGQQFEIGSVVGMAAEYDTLTSARKAAKSGSAIVRASDRVVVSVK